MRKQMGAACLMMSVSVVAGAQDLKGDSQLLVRWQLTKGGIQVAQHTFDPSQHHVDEWRDIREFKYRQGCVAQGVPTATQYGAHVWINSGAIANGIAAMDVRVEARGEPAELSAQGRGCDVPTPAQSEHEMKVSTVATTGEDTIADQWDDYRLVVRLVPR